jgi:hypothetical protein
VELQEPGPQHHHDPEHAVFAIGRIVGEVECRLGIARDATASSLLAGTSQDLDIPSLYRAK